MREELAAAERSATDEETVSLIAGLRQDADRAMESVRDTARGIYPPLLAQDGLVAALADELKVAGIPTRVDAGTPPRGRREAEAAVYYSCVEAVQNAAKHAGPAAHATVSIEHHDGRLMFSVRDNGRGFDPRAAAEGSGLTNIRDRIEAVGGTVEISSVPGGGTTLAGTVPW